MPQAQLQPGYKRATVRENIAALVREGRSESEATAIAYRQARKALRERFSEGVEVFRAGNYPGKIPVTERDIQSIVQTYNTHQAGRGPRYEAADKFTHDSGRPSEGWVSRLIAKGRSLIAQHRDPTDDLLNNIIDERYPNPSIELRRNFVADDGTECGLSLKAVAWLGADPPAVKQVAAFSEDSDGEQIVLFTFEEWSQNQQEAHTCLIPMVVRRPCG